MRLLFAMAAALALVLVPLAVALCFFGASGLVVGGLGTTVAGIGGMAVHRLRRNRRSKRA